MSFYKSVAAWASNMDEKVQERRKNKLTKSFFMNSLHAFSGEMHTLMATSAPLLVNRINDLLAKFSSDLCVVFKELQENYGDKFQIWIEGSFKLFENSMTHTMHTFNEAAEMRHRQADERAGKRQNAFMSIVAALMKQLQSKDLNDSERYLEVIERIRLMEERNMEAHHVTFNTMIALNEHIVGQIRGEGSSIVALDWFTEHADELIRLAAQMYNLRESTVPPNEAIAQAVKCLKAINDNYNVTEIQQVLHDKARAWGVA